MESEMKSPEVIPSSFNNVIENLTGTKEMKEKLPTEQIDGNRKRVKVKEKNLGTNCLLYTSPSPRD